MAAAHAERPAQDDAEAHLAPTPHCSIHLSTTPCTGVRSSVISPECGRDDIFVQRVTVGHPRYDGFRPVPIGAEPVSLRVDGEPVFAGKLKRDLYVCLAQAARTRDFERLRWAGLRVAASGEVKRVTGRTGFAPLLMEHP